MRKRSLIAAGLMILCIGLTACSGSKGTDNGSNNTAAEPEYIHRLCSSLQMDC